MNLAAVTTAPQNLCASGFTCADIGGPGVPAGNQLYSNGTWTMQASGDIWSVYDEFRYAYQSFPGSPVAPPTGTAPSAPGSSPRPAAGRGCAPAS